MRINKLEELQKIHLGICDKICVEDYASTKNNEIMLYEAVKKIVELSNIARMEGLLALEEGISLQLVEEDLKQLIGLIVDGTESDVVLGIGLARYYANLYTDYHALRYFIYLEGVLSIQAGDNPRILQEKLKAMLPSNMYLQYSASQEQKRIEKIRYDNMLEKLCKVKRPWKQGENGYYLSKLMDYTICDIKSEELQKVLKTMQNRVLALAMKGMSGEARGRVFSNLSERLVKEIAEDMISMGPVREIDVLEAIQQLLTRLIELIYRGEVSRTYQYLKPYCCMSDVD